MSNRLLQRVLIVSLVGLLAGIAVEIAHRSGGGSAGSGGSAASAAPARFDGPLMPPHLRAANFSLTDQDGRRVTLAQYRGHVVVLTFIHSLCPDTCPLMTEQIKGALNELPGGGRDVPAIGISVAPGEDTSAHRRWFLRQHEMTGRMAFLSGSTAQLRAVWHAYAIQPVTPGVDHSTFVLLIDRRGFERVGFPADELTPEALAHDIAVLEHERG